MQSLQKGVYNGLFMERFSRGEKLGLGAIALELGLAVVAFTYALRQPESLDRPRGETQIAVMDTLNHTSSPQRYALQDTDEEEDVEVDAGARPIEETELPRLTLTPQEAPPEKKWDWTRLAEMCKSGELWCFARPGGWGIMIIPPDNTHATVHTIPARPRKNQKIILKAAGVGHRRGTLHVTLPPQKIPKPKILPDDIAARIRQFQMDDLTTVFQGMERDHLRLTQGNATLLLMLLNDMSRDPTYAADMLRNLNTSCAAFIGNVTLMVNQYAIENDEPPDAGAPTQKNAAFLSWLRGIENLGFAPNAYGALVWENVPLGLKECHATQE